MQIVLNGEPVILQDNITIARLIDQSGLAGKRLAVEINQDIVPRSAHATTCLHEDDRVEIVHAIGGG